MQGDDRSRFCGQCNLHVYNFAQMSPEEIEQLLVEKEAGICARMYQRSDGTILTRDCPIGLRSTIQRAGRIVVSALSAVMGVCVAAAQTIPKQNSMKVETATTSLAITVTDPSGGFIPDCDITLKSLENRVVFLGKTDEAGYRRIDGILPGAYNLRLACPAFTPDEIEIKATSWPISIKRRLQMAPLMGAVVVISDTFDTGPAVPQPFIQIEPIPLVSLGTRSPR